MQYSLTNLFAMCVCEWLVDVKIMHIMFVFFMNGNKQRMDDFILFFRASCIRVNEADGWGKKEMAHNG